MRKILLVGAGQIGSRHLQGLARSTLGLTIEMLEPRASAREIAAARFGDVTPTGGAKELRSIENLDQSSFDGSADLAIIATTAAVRCDVIQNVLDRLTIPFLVLEKVLFQRISDVDNVEKLLAERSCLAWVNCSRRMLTYGTQLRRLFSGEVVSIHAHGANWGLGSNGIHLLDFLAFLSGASHPDGWNVDCLDKTSYKSKREHYWEFGGRLGFHLPGGHEIVMEDNKSGTAPLVIEIEGRHARATIVESTGLMTLSTRDNRWKTETFRIDVPHQSELTNLVAEDILSGGSCSLTDYGESARLHRAYLGALLEHIENVTGVSHDVCPIT